LAENQGCLDRDLHCWVPHAFTAARKVRSTTGIGESTVSASSAAVELAEKIFEDLSGRKAVLLDAGKMRELAALHLKEAGVTSITVVNRTQSRSRERRQAESVEAKKLLQLALDRLLKEESRSRSGPAIAAICNEVHSVCRDELERFEQRVPALSSEQKAEIEMMLYRIAQKIVHPAIMELKKAEQRESVLWSESLESKNIGAAGSGQ